jgi:hypothetical protein
MMVATPHLERMPYTNLAVYQLASLIGVIGALHTRTLWCSNFDTSFLLPVADTIITITGQSTLSASMTVLRLHALHTVQ